MRALTLIRGIGLMLVLLAPIPSFGEAPKKAPTTSLQQKFGVAALLSESSESFVDAVRAGSEAPRLDFPISRPKPIPTPVAPKPSSDVPNFADANPAEIAKIALEDRKREIQMLELKIARENALLALKAVKQAPVVKAAPRTASDRLLASLGSREAAPSFQSAAEDGRAIDAIKKKQQLAYLTNASGGRELQTQLEYHSSPRGSVRGRLQRQVPARSVSGLVPPRPAPFLEGSYRHVAKGEKAAGGHSGAKSDVSAAGLVAGVAPAPVFIEIPRAVRVITDAGGGE